MKRLAYLGVVVLLAISVAGCTTGGRDFDEKVIPRIVKGKTTKAQIQEWLGSPQERGLQEGLETWTYRFVKNLGPLTQGQTKDLAVWFEKSGVVNTFSYTTNFAPWKVSK